MLFSKKTRTPHNRAAWSIERTLGRYAVLLNARARGWTGELHQAVLRYVPSEDLYLTEDFRQAERTVDNLIQAGYRTLFTGGGDGTIVYLANAIEERIRSGTLKRDDAPAIGVLRMGTGNAVATYLGCRDIVTDLRALRSGSPLKIFRIPFLEEDDDLFPFAGVGWDAEILNDYDGFKELVRDTAIENYATGLTGYAMSVATRSVPRAIRQDARHIRITTLSEAYSIDTQGDVCRTFDAGDILYEGMSRVCGASTIPYWGFQIRMFPFADARPGFFQLRSYHGNVRRIMTRLNDFWQGTFSPDSLVDFLASDVRIEVEQGAMAYQVAGDAAGYERAVRWSLCEHPCQLAIPMH